MGTQKSYIFLFIGFFISIFIFLNGFLMNRSEIHDINTCPTNHAYCKYSPYKKIVVLLVDALKYEFIDPSFNQSNNYHGNVDIVRSLKTSNKRKYSYLNHFISDPPTTTLQRIKGLTTGSLPTFIDISNNFGSSELIEDSIIHQWQKFGYEVKFAGDDTWTHLFPGRFNISKPYPSFNVKDLDTVDRGVEKFIIEHLSRNTSASNLKPEILLGHMLGIDHCGHTYGKNHPQMKRKLNELNDFLKKIISLMDKDTLFIMFGDHGMTSSGDHGGESVEEVDSALFMVSEKPLNFHRQNSVEQRQLANLLQIDIVPTLAALTGVAIPFSNLGILRPEMLTSLERADQYLQMNKAQITQYIGTYEKQFGNLNFPSDIRQYLTSTSNVTLNIEQSLTALRTIPTHFRAKWAQFNVTLIFSGICGCVLYLVSILSNILQYNSTLKWRFALYLLLSILQIFVTDSLALIVAFVFLSIVESIFVAKKLVIVVSSLEDKLQSVLVLISLAYILVPFSNSFIVSEDRIVQYFLQSILLIKSIQCLVQYTAIILPRKLKRNDKTKTGLQFGSLLTILSLFLLGTAFLIVGMAFKICREEQQTWCTSESTPSSSAQFITLIVPLLIVVHRLWLNHCGNLASNDFNVLIVKYALPFAGICLFCHHCMQFVDESSKYIYVVKSTFLVFPRIAVLTAFSSLCFLIVNPLLMFHRKKFDNIKRIDVPSLFRYLCEKQSDAYESVVVHGLASIYSSFVFSGLLATCILVTVFLKVQFVLGILAVFGFLCVYSVLSARLMDCKPIDVCASVPIWEMSLVVTLLTQYGFFSTGHQATISNIPWYAAFTAWSGDHSTQLLPAIMLNINIFSAHILLSLFGLLIPVLILLISVGPAHPFSRSSVNRKELSADKVSMNLGDFYLFKSDDYAAKFTRFLRQYYIVYLACQSAVTLGTVISAAIARRHLMAWKIFVPKMLYSVIGLSIVYLATVLSYWIIQRVHRAAINWRQRNTE